MSISRFESYIFYKAIILTITSIRAEELTRGFDVFLNLVNNVHLGAKPSKPDRFYNLRSK